MTLNIHSQDNTEKHNILKSLKERFQQGQADKSPWEAIYNEISRYFFGRDQSFNSSGKAQNTGDFTYDELFSSSPENAANTMASTLLGQLWPSGARSFRLVRPHNITDTKEVKEYYRKITKVAANFMDRPKAKLSPSLSEYMIDMVTYGICGIEVKEKEGLNEPLRFIPHNVKNFVIEENSEGDVNCIFITRTLTVRNIVAEYGLDAVSKRVKELYKEREDKTTIEVIQIVEPRDERSGAFGNKKLPFSSIHFEMESNHVLKESGFQFFPISVSRMEKALGEVYGRSPAMRSIPSVKRLQSSLMEWLTQMNKRGKPPMYMLDSGTLGNTVVDLTPGNWTILETLATGDGPPFGPVMDYPDPSSYQLIIEFFSNEVSQSFMLDRLLDFNNEVKMTLGETEIRNRLRGETLSSLYSRQEAEIFTPLIESSINILFSKGLLGVVSGDVKEKDLIAANIEPIIIPEEIIKELEQGRNVYDIEYISPASRMMRTENMEAVQQLWQFALGVASAQPNILDNLDGDLAIKQVATFYAEENALRSLLEVEEIRKVRGQQIQQAQQSEMLDQQADQNMKNAQAFATMKGSTSNPEGKQ